LAAPLREAYVFNDSRSQVDPELTECRSVPLSPAIQKSVGPAKRMSFKPNDVPDGIRDHIDPELVVEKIVPFTPAMMPEVGL